MATNACDVNLLEPDSRLPPRKRLLAGFKKQNSMIGNESPSPPFACSSSITSNGSSSASPDMQTHLDNLLTSQLNDQTGSPEEVAEASKEAAALAVKLAKAARAKAIEKAIIASKAVAAAKNALELLHSFPVEAVASKERSPRKKKHVPVKLLYSKGKGAAVDEDLASRLDRAINNSPRVLRDSSGHKNKKQKTVTIYDGDDVAGVVDSDSSNDVEVDRNKLNGKLPLCDNTQKEKTREESSSSSLGKRRGRVKLKKLPLSMCTSKEQEDAMLM